jgi:hypothetical protein
LLRSASNANNKAYELANRQNDLSQPDTQGAAGSDAHTSDHPVVHAGGEHDCCGGVASLESHSEQAAAIVQLTVADFSIVPAGILYFPNAILRG